MKGTYRLKLSSSPFKPSTKLLSNKPVIKQLGFTIVELVIVILLVGILAINVGTRFFSNSSFANRNVADELVEAIRYAQHIAMSRGGNIQVVTDATTYRIEESTCASPPCPIPNPNRSGNYTVTIPSNSLLNASSPTISFNGLGQPTPNTNSTITIGNPIAFTITIEGETGYAYY